jgi:hypothetical protein
MIAAGQVGVNAGVGVSFKFLPYQDRTEKGWTYYKTLVGDVNGDGLVDLIWSSTGDINRTYVGLGKTDGTFSFLPYQDRTERSWSTYKTLVGDVNGDGLVDLIWNSTGDINRTYVGLGTESGTIKFLSPYQDHPKGGWQYYNTLVGDVNGDGLADLIWNETSNTNRTYVGLGQQNGTFKFLDYQDHPGGSWSNYKTRVGDVNGDGMADLIWNETSNTNRTYVGLGQKDGTFNFLDHQDLGIKDRPNYSILVGDVDGDGRADLIWNEISCDIAQPGQELLHFGLIYVCLAQEKGTFSSPQEQYVSEGGCSKTLVGDVNGDGRADLIWNDTCCCNRISVGLGQKDGKFEFQRVQVHPKRGWSGYKTLVGDVNGDGMADLIWNLTSDINRTYVGLAQVP